MSTGRIRVTILAILSLVIVAALAVGALSVLTFAVYKPDAVAEACLESNSEIGVYYKDNYIAFTPMDSSSDTGLIFYPGAFVSAEAYSPMMDELAHRGVTCILLKIPFSFSLIDINAADGIRDNFVRIKHWYIGGHSLGGVSAAKYLEKNSKGFEGLIMFAAYSVTDLSDSGLRCLSLYGSLDSVLKIDSYNKNFHNLPAGTEEMIIEGGNHSYFGNYGGQVGDTRGTINAEEQVIIASEKIAEFTGAAERRAAFYAQQQKEEEQNAAALETDEIVKDLPDAEVVSETETAEVADEIPEETSTAA